MNGHYLKRNRKRELAMIRRLPYVVRDSRTKIRGNVHASAGSTNLLLVLKLSQGTTYARI